MLGVRGHRECLYVFGELLWANDQDLCKTEKALGHPVIKWCILPPRVSIKKDLR